jgi:hypothetical protein
MPKDVGVKCRFCGGDRGDREHRATDGTPLQCAVEFFREHIVVIPVTVPKR